MLHSFHWQYVFPVVYTIFNLHIETVQWIYTLDDDTLFSASNFWLFMVVLYFKRTCNKEVITLQTKRAIHNVNSPTKFLLLTSLTTSFLPLRSKRCIFSTAFLTESADSNSTIPHPLGLSFSSWNSSTYATSPTGNKETQLYAAIFSTPGLSTL